MLVRGAAHDRSTPSSPLGVVCCHETGDLLKCVRRYSASSKRAARSCRSPSSRSLRSSKRASASSLRPSRRSASSSRARSFRRTSRSCWTRRSSVTSIFLADDSDGTPGTPRPKARCRWRTATPRGPGSRCRGAAGPAGPPRSTSPARLPIRAHIADLSSSRRGRVVSRVHAAAVRQRPQSRGARARAQGSRSGRWRRRRPIRRGA